MSHAQIDVTKEKLYGEFETVVAETSSSLKSIAGRSGDKVVALKASMEQGLADARERLARFAKPPSARPAPRRGRTDEYVHDNPWRAVGFVAAAGHARRLIAGLIIRASLTRAMSVGPPTLPSREDCSAPCAPWPRRWGETARVRGRAHGHRNSREFERRKHQLVLAALAAVFLTMALLLLVLLVAVVFLGYRTGSRPSPHGRPLPRLRRRGARPVAASRSRRAPAPFAATLGELDRDLADLSLAAMSARLEDLAREKELLLMRSALCRLKLRRRANDARRVASLESGCNRGGPPRPRSAAGPRRGRFPWPA